MFSSKKLENSTQPSIKPNLVGYRQLQREIRTIKEELFLTQEHLKEYEENLVNEFSIVRQEIFDPFTIIELAYGNYKAVGISRRSEFDNQRKDLGFNIALGRAQRALLDKINGERITQKEILAG